jgi:hypothetical protein
MLETEHSVTFCASRRRRDQNARGDAATRRLYQQKDNEKE